MYRAAEVGTDLRRMPPPGHTNGLRFRRVSGAPCFRRAREAAMAGEDDRTDPGPASDAEDDTIQVVRTDPDGLDGVRAGPVLGADDQRPPDRGPRHRSERPARGRHPPPRGPGDPGRLAANAGRAVLRHRPVPGPAVRSRRPWWLRPRLRRWRPRLRRLRTTDRPRRPRLGLSALGSTAGWSALGPTARRAALGPAARRAAASAARRPPVAVGGDRRGGGAGPARRHARGGPDRPEVAVGDGRRHRSGPAHLGRSHLHRPRSRTASAARPRSR